MHEILHYVGKSEESHKLTSDDLHEEYKKCNKYTKYLSLQNLNKIRCRFSTLDDGFTLHSSNNGAWEAITQKALENHILGPVRKIFQVLFASKNFELEILNQTYRNQSDKSDSELYQAKPDLMFSVDNTPLVCIEVKYPSINFEDETEFMHMFSQAVYQCICSKTEYGIITDYQTVFTFKLELEEKDFENIKQITDEIKRGRFSHRLKRLRVTYCKVKHDGSLHTPSAVVFLHCLKAYLASLDKEKWTATQNLIMCLACDLNLGPEGQNQRAKDEYDEFFAKLDRNQTTDSTKVLLDLGKGKSEEHKLFVGCLDDSEFEVIQEGPGANAQVLKINKHLFKRITKQKPKRENYILKIFDPVGGKKDHGDFVFTKPSYMHFTRKTALKERELYRLLKKLWGRCVPRVYDFGCCILKHQGRWRFGGFYIVLQYLQGSPLNFADEALANSARTHLAAIHALGIAHGDIKPANMINQNGRIFFIDFGFSTSDIYESKYRAYRTDTGEKEVSLMELDNTTLNGCF